MIVPVILISCAPPIRLPFRWTLRFAQGRLCGCAQVLHPAMRKPRMSGTPALRQEGKESLLYCYCFAAMNGRSSTKPLD
jgi:hypothetical protein